MRKHFLAILTTAFLAFLASSAFAQSNVLVELNKIYPEELRWQGFALDSEQEIQIDAAGVYMDEGRDERLMFGYCWILNAQSREVVWEFQPEEFGRKNQEARQISENIKLPAGTYEVYYSSYPYYERENGWGFTNGNWNRGFVGRMMDRIFDHGDRFEHTYRDELSREFFVTIRGNGKKVNQEALRSIQEKFKTDALISISAGRDDLYERQGFVLEQSMELEIYAIGEARRKENFDYGFIMNTESREKVWLLDYDHTDYAGGALKNRMARETITLPAGRYVAVMTTDDSHSPREWNSPPPNDPVFWGLTVSAKNSNQKKYFSKYDYEDAEMKNAIVAFNRLRNNAFESKGFTLKKPMDLHIYAIGEGRDDEMFDYGWIVNAKTNEKVWVMDFYDTEHAGGGEKNRLVDKVAKFEKGSYIAYFITDDSHSYRDWNTSPPYDREHWGLVLSGADKNFNPNDVAEYTESEDPDILAKLVRVRDNASERLSFTLEKDSEVTVYAMGEGSDGDMFDYGWIENAETGKVVWEMTYRRSDYAGGAKKNRMLRETINLKAGKYTVYYESDGSHSFRDWNASPPHDPINWGITVSLAK